MVSYINERVYKEVTKTCEYTNQDEVGRIYDFMAITMSDIIKTDNPNVSLKMDHIGNLYSHPYRREMIIKLKENNGQSTDIEG